MNKKLFCPLAALLFIFLLSVPAGAGDVMSWSPRTPAGGAPAAAEHFQDTALAVEYGAEAFLFNPATETVTVYDQEVEEVGDFSVIKGTTIQTSKTRKP